MATTQQEKETSLIAIHNFTATESDDLPFQIGDKIIGLTLKNDWWFGRIGDKEGSFPNNYVKVVAEKNNETPKKISKSKKKQRASILNPAMQKDLQKLTGKKIDKSKKYGIAWKEDSKTKNCTLCEKKFSLTKRRHHCRKCGEIFCHSCSKTKLTVKGSNNKKRVCDSCVTNLSKKEKRNSNIKAVQKAKAEAEAADAITGEKKVDVDEDDEPESDYDDQDAMAVSAASPAAVAAPTAAAAPEESKAAQLPTPSEEAIAEVAQKEEELRLHNVHVEKEAKVAAKAAKDAKDANAKKQKKEKQKKEEQKKEEQKKNNDKKEKELKEKKEKELLELEEKEKKEQEKQEKELKEKEELEEKEKEEEVVAAANKKKEEAVKKEKQKKDKEDKDKEKKEQEEKELKEKEELEKKEKEKEVVAAANKKKEEAVKKEKQKKDKEAKQKETKQKEAKQKDKQDSQQAASFTAEAKESKQTKSAAATTTTTTTATTTSTTQVGETKEESKQKETAPLTKKQIQFAADKEAKRQELQTLTEEAVATAQQRLEAYSAVRKAYNGPMSLPTDEELIALYGSSGPALREFAIATHLIWRIDWSDIDWKAPLQAWSPSSSDSRMNDLFDPFGIQFTTENKLGGWGDTNWNKLSEEDKAKPQLQVVTKIDFGGSCKFFIDMFQHSTYSRHMLTFFPFSLFLLFSFSFSSSFSISLAGGLLKKATDKFKDYAYLDLPLLPISPIFETLRGFPECKILDIDVFAKLKPVKWLSGDFFAPIAAMKNLEQIKTGGFQGSFPKGLSNMSQLLELRLNNSTNIFSPLDVSKMTSLTNLDFNKIGIVEIVGIDKLKKLKTFKLKTMSLGDEWCYRKSGKNLVTPTIPSGINTLDSLKHLSLDGFKDLEQLPADLLSTSMKLEILEVCNMEKLTSLPQLSNSLKQLKLYSIGKKNMSPTFELSEQIGDISSLEEISFTSGSGLTRLPKSLEKLKWLKELKICDALFEEMQLDFSKLMYLKDVEFSNCSNLKTLGNVSMCTALQRLILKNNKKLNTWDVEALSKMSNLRRVEITGSSGLHLYAKGELLYLMGRVRNPAKDSYDRDTEKLCDGAFLCDLTEEQAVNENRLIDVGCRKCSYGSDHCHKFSTDNDVAMKYEFYKRKAWFQDPSGKNSVVDGRKKFLEYYDKYCKNKGPPESEWTTEAEWNAMEALIIPAKEKAEVLFKAAKEKKEKELKFAKLESEKVATGASSKTPVIVSANEGESKNDGYRKEQMVRLAKRREFVTNIRQEKISKKEKSKQTVWKEGGTTGKELKNDNEAIQALEKGADANEYNHEFFKERALSKLFFRKLKEHKELVLSLLSSDHIDLSEKTKFGDTFLIGSLEGTVESRWGDCAVFEQILNMGEDPNSIQHKEFAGGKEKKYLFFECVKSAYCAKGDDGWSDYRCGDAFKVILKYGFDVDAPIPPNLLCRKYKETQITYRQLLTTVAAKYTYDTNEEAHIPIISFNYDATKSQLDTAQRHTKTFMTSMNKRLAESLLEAINTTKLLEVTDSELTDLEQEYERAQAQSIGGGGGCCVIA